MALQARKILPAFLVVLLFLTLGKAEGQPANGRLADGWWVSVTIEGGTDRTVDQRQDRQGYGARSRGLQIPKGHLPPPGECRLWFPGHPPGKQPPPTSCTEAYSRHSGSALVVTHSGRIHSGRKRAGRIRSGRIRSGRIRRQPQLRWKRRPAKNIAFRRRPGREEGETFDVEVIIDLTGKRGYRRLQARRKDLGVRGSLEGRWISTASSGGGVLQVRAGTRPLAELVDRDGDLRVEEILVPEDRRSKRDRRRKR